MYAGGDFKLRFGDVIWVALVEETVDLKVFLMMSSEVDVCLESFRLSRPEAEFGGERKWSSKMLYSHSGWLFSLLNVSDVSFEI